MTAEKKYDRTEAEALLDDFLDGKAKADLSAVHREAIRVVSEVASITEKLGLQVIGNATSTFRIGIAGRDEHAELRVTESGKILVSPKARVEGASAGEPDPKEVSLRFNRIDGRLESLRSDAEGRPRSAVAEVVDAMLSVMRDRADRMGRRF